MNDNPKSSGIAVERRRFLESLPLVTTIQIAGCGEADGDDSGASTAERPRIQGEPSRMSQEIESEIEELETVFEALSDLPIQRSRTFAFDVQEFDNEFDHQTLLKTCDSIMADLRSIDSPKHDGSTVSVILTVAEIAKRLVQQRIVLHQVIAAGLEFRKEFYRTNFRKADEVMTDSRQFVTQLKKLGVNLEEKLKKVDGGVPPIDVFDRDAIEKDQRVLLDIILWTDHSYEGLHYASRGVASFVEGNSALEDERYGEAERIYSDSHDHFMRAQEAFESAQNKGTRLPYMAPFVDEVRCILPAYLDSTTGLSESMRYIDAGKEERGKDLAREAFARADRLESRCK